MWRDSRGEGLAAIGGWPLLAAALLQSIPLTLQVEGPQEVLSEELNAEIVRRVSTLGPETTVVPLLVWGGLYLVAALSLLGAPRPRLPLRRFLPAVALLALVALSAAWSGHPGKVLMNAGHAAGAMLIALAAAHRYRSALPTAIRHLALALGLNACLQLASVLLAPGVTIDADGRWVGLGSNANLLAFIATAALWANLATLFVARRRSTALHLALGGVAAVLLAGTRSVTSSAAAAVALAGLALMALMASSSGRRERLLWAAFAAVAAPLAAGAGLWVASSWSTVTGLVGRTPDLSGRMDLWGVGWGLLRERLWLGWSFDDNATVLDRISTGQSHFHNGLLDVAVRGGLVGAVLLAALLLATLRDVRRAGRVFPSASVGLLPMLAAFVVTNLAEATIGAWRSISWLLVMFAMCWSGLARLRAGPAARARTS